MKRYKLLAILPICLLVSITGNGQTKEIPLWSNGAPGSEGKPTQEIIRVDANGERFLTNIHQPSLTPYVPDAKKSTGTAIIIAPGGGHRELRIDNEGFLFARRFQDKGIAAFVLKYRLAREPNSTYTVDKDELADIQRAIRLVKSRANEWNIDTARAGVMGFSAGGELAALAAMKFDQGNKQAPDPIDHYGSRPAFQALIYPGAAKRFDVVANIPPVFLAAGYKDRPDISEGIVPVYLKYKQAGVKADLHIYSEAGHGFAVDPTSKNSSSAWLDLFTTWLSDLEFLKKL